MHPSRPLLLLTLQLAGCSTKPEGDSGSVADPGTLSLTLTGAVEGTFPAVPTEVQCLEEWVWLSWDNRESGSPDGGLRGLVRVGLGREVVAGTTVTGLSREPLFLWMDLIDADGTHYERGDDSFTVTVDTVWEPTAGSFEATLWPVDASFELDQTQPSATATATFTHDEDPCPTEG